MPDVLTVMEAVNRSARFLAERGAESPRLSAELLLAHVLGRERLWLYLNYDRPLSDDERDAYRELVRRRAQHEPVAYLIGRKEFYSLDFGVSPAVLIPRPETEHLVETALRHCKERALAAPRILDIGVGSGAIIIALLHALPQSRGVGIDISRAALAVAEQNAARHNVLDRLALVEADMEQVEPLNDEAAFDIVVANPPYITDAERDALMSDVRDYEPPQALFCGADPLRYYRAAARLAAAHLVDDGLLALELSAKHGSEICGYLKQTGDWRQLRTTCDLAGVQRVWQGIRCKNNASSP